VEVADMRLRRLAFLWLAMSLVTGVILTISCAVMPGQINEKISSKQAYNLIQQNKNNPDFVILDVRRPEEFTAEHLENAVNVDYEASDFREKANQLDKDKTYLLYCRTGRRSAEAAAIMKELGFQRIYDMGGIQSWKEAGYPTVQ
jgi:rhodanese-related sulfurtransferase